MNDETPPSDDQESTEIVPADWVTPDRVGPYKFLQKLGEGGMGVVYLAEQEHPIRRRVALKIIKLGMDTKQVVARFESERQALALMNHPNVAKVLDAGATEQGRPYFVMEYVKGVPITEHCDRQRLPTKERLQIFAQVCEGVQHAHQKGIIHRDIKPSNILVQVDGDKRIPKIIDFGVAKATRQRLTERTVFTELGQFTGTPEYMSPEQAEMTAEDIDTRTDVYSLGVLLYELLVGALPFDPKELRQAGFDEIRRRIREEEPLKPSTRISSLGEASTGSAQRRRTDPASLIRQIRGDLDWITMKALEKDRTRRYGSPNELAADIGRHLNDEPVLASPPSTLYRTGKFVRRHRFGVAATVLALGGLIAFSVTTSVQSRRIAQEARTSERVSEFLADMLGNVDPQMLGIALWKDLRERAAEAQRERGASEQEIETVLALLTETLAGMNATDAALRLVDEQILSRAGETIERELAKEPRIAARLEHTIGWTYRELGLYAQAEPHAIKAAETRKRMLGDDHPDTLWSMNNLAILYKNQGRYDEAEKLHRETLEIQRRVLGQDHLDTLRSMTSLANLYKDQGRYDEAEPLSLETLEAHKRVLGDDHPETLGCMGNLANLYQKQGRYDEAERLNLEVLETIRRVLGDDHPDTTAAMQNLANLYLSQRRYDEAESVFLAALEANRRMFGDDHPRTLMLMNNLGIIYWHQGRQDESESMFPETLETYKRKLGDAHPETLRTMNNLGTIYSIQGRYDESASLILETLEIRKRLLGDDHPDTLSTEGNLASLYYRQGRYDEAEPLYSRSLEAQERLLGENHPDTVGSLYNLACFEAMRGNAAKAMDWLRQSVDALVERARQNAAAQQP